MVSSIPVCASDSPSRKPGFLSGRNYRLDSILGVCDAKHVMDQLQEVRDTWIYFGPGVVWGEANYFYFWRLRLLLHG